MTSAAPSTPSVSGHVLLVDDELAYQRLGASFLRQLGYRVSVAGDVDSALQAFADDRCPHVVLLDLAMPPSMDPQAGLSLIPYPCAIGHRGAERPWASATLRCRRSSAASGIF